MKWYIEDAIYYIREINEIIQKFDFHLGLIGSVLIKGESHNDLDVAILPYEGEEKKPNYVKIKLWLHNIGATKINNRNEAGYLLENREIWKLELPGGRKIDYFLY